VAILVAQPTSINTNIAPGDTLENNNPATMGVDAVYQGNIRQVEMAHDWVSVAGYTGLQ